MVDEDIGMKTCQVDLDFQKIHFARQQSGDRPVRPSPTDNAAKLFF
jgi:hypothetical protein